MKIPTNLRHKPVFVSQDYDNVDGRILHSDAKGLSLGLAQWNDRGRLDISAKVWRFTGERWSRQSEELPLHRLLDLTIFFCRSWQYLREADQREAIFDRDKPQVDRIPLQGSALNVAVCTENEMIDEDIRLFQSSLAEDDELLSERLHRLGSLLREMGY